jgi:hypothetical protein
MPGIVYLGRLESPLSTGQGVLLIPTHQADDIGAAELAFHLFGDPPQYDVASKVACVSLRFLKPSISRNMTVRDLLYLRTFISSKSAASWNARVLSTPAVERPSAPAQPGSRADERWPVVLHGPRLPAPRNRLALSSPWNRDRGTWPTWSAAASDDFDYPPDLSALQPHFDAPRMGTGARQHILDNSLCHPARRLIRLHHDKNSHAGPDPCTRCRV